jgi:serine/threonine protein kinase
MCLHKETNT